MSEPEPPNRRTSGPVSPPQRWTVQAQHTVSYDVEICRDLLDLDNGTLAAACAPPDTAAGGPVPRRVVVVVDDAVDLLHGDRIRAYFACWRFLVDYLRLAGEERDKTLDSAVAVTRQIGASGLLRRSQKVVVIGGGVVMDVVGLAASLFRRGVPYVRVPTTLLGQVDAGVGVKTAVNQGQHKNRLGTYFAPEHCLIDPAFLTTLPARHVRSGLAEIVKLALVTDAGLFALLEDLGPGLDGTAFGRYSAPHVQLLHRAVAGMLEELAPNLREVQLERLLDFGHTFSPALELVTEPGLLHGEAVAVDMALSIGLSMHRGLLSRAEGGRVLRLIDALGLPLTDPMVTSSLLGRALHEAVAHRDGLQRIPLVRAIGQAEFVNDVTVPELHHALAAVEGFARGQSAGGPRSPGRTLHAPPARGAPTEPSRFAITQDCLVLDIGGTWLRTGRWSCGTGLVEVRRESSPGRSSLPDAAGEVLVDALFERILQVARAERPGGVVSVSLGAALSHRDGTVYGSGPLWGAHVPDRDLRAELEARRPDLRWHLVNDVTATLLAYLWSDAGALRRRTLVVTLGTGVASRLFDPQRGVCVDGAGLQGEIGHLSTPGDGMPCDCGGVDHVASYVSGPGLRRVAHARRDRCPARWARSMLAERADADEEFGPTLRRALDHGDPLARDILRTAMRPLADVFVTGLTLDPGIDAILLTGGLADSLGEHLVDAVGARLRSHGPYVTSTVAPRWAVDKLRLFRSDDRSNLVGAAAAASGLLDRAGPARRAVPRGRAS